MSTDYRVCGRGVRLTERKIRAIAKQAGWVVLSKGDKMDGGETIGDGHLIVGKDGYGWVHHYKSGKTAWNGFTRYGGNYLAADQWIEFLNASGYSVLSEHDAGFF